MKINAIVARSIAAFLVATAGCSSATPTSTSTSTISTSTSQTSPMDIETRDADPFEPTRQEVDFSDPAAIAFTVGCGYWTHPVRDETQSEIALRLSPYVTRELRDAIIELPNRRSVVTLTNLGGYTNPDNGNRYIVGCPLQQIPNATTHPVPDQQTSEVWVRRNESGEYVAYRLSADNLVMPPPVNDDFS